VLGCDAVNITVFRGYQRVLYKGYVWFNKPPYHYEREIELHTDRVLCLWYDR